MIRLARTLLLVAFGAAATATAAVAPDLASAPAERPTAQAIERMLSCYVFVGGGSGVLVREDGLILTNNHVIDGVEDLTVRTSDGHTWPTTLLGTDPVGDIALLRIDPHAAAGHRFPAAAFAPVEELQPGLPVVAIGNPFALGDFDDVPTVSTGVLGTGRIVRGDYTDAVQADAPVNPGNSGGPLFDLQGRLLGINGQIRSLTGFRINSGIGLAVDAPQLQQFAPLLEQARGGYVRHTAPPAGLALAATDDGVVVKTPGTSGLHAGDRLLSIDGRACASLATTQGLFAAHARDAQAQASVVVMRDNAALTVTVPLGHTPIPGHAYHGLSFVEDQGMTIIDHVDPGSPAAAEGLVPGTVVTQVGGEPVAGKISLLRALVKLEIGDRLHLTVRLPTGQEKPVEVLLKAHP